MAEMSKIKKAQLVKDVTRKLVDEDRLIEAGWITLKAVYIHPEAPPAQIEAMRNAFFAGAQHLFSSIMVMMDPEIDPTTKDLSRMQAISDELDAFLKEFKEKHGIAGDFVTFEDEDDGTTH